MTINHPERFGRAKPAGFDGVFEWDFLLPAFAGTKITPMDIDCIIERNGQFLVFETKDNGAPIPRGQVITLETLAMTGLFTIVVLHAKTERDVNGWDIWRRGRNGLVKKHREGDAEALMRFTRSWFHWTAGA